ncbi:hypothetical protein N657DRAFT_639696 [Parathielavia appendiculata]|uniref:Uncharacterized protein n=1 Tax=Parathielavia appendiculata TaxID=2587402 RepID=A0AAN6U9Y8_9PEZI|nr:hypothetical protein N657DRAFT_639696 [Parathielavia appendiculata]
MKMGKTLAPEAGLPCVIPDGVEMHAVGTFSAEHASCGPSHDWQCGRCQSDFVPVMAEALALNAASRVV